MKDSSSRSLSTGGWLLRLALLGSPALLACGARSGLDCFGERCGVGGEVRGPDDDPDGDDPVGDDPVGNVPPVQVPDRPAPVPPSDLPPDFPGKQPSTGCGPAGRFDGSLVITSEQELDALVGCREVVGDLIITGLVVDDLRELGELRSVTGTLELSSLSGSLEGLENLRSVNNLLLVDLNVPSFTPFVSLLQIGSNPLDENAGQLAISQPEGPFDLSGFSSLLSVRSLSLTECGTLQTLTGLTLPSAMTLVALSNCPGLVNVSPLASLVELGTLHFSDLGIAAVDGLLNLFTVRSLALINLPSLVDLAGLSNLSAVGVFYLDNTAVGSLSGLSQLVSVENAVISNNASLTDLGGFTSLGALTELSVTDNANLATLPEFSNIGVMEQLVVRRNPLLVSGPGFPNLADIGQLDISENASLTLLGPFPRLQTARTIAIRDNAALTSIDFAGLSNVRNLHISCNPVLPESSVTPLASLSGTSVIQGNEGSASPCVAEDPL